MKLSEQIKFAKSTKQVHSNWYRDQYPDVRELGMDPPTHYLMYGAAMGRNPNKNFDTKFYLQTYPQVAESGLNPLVHYALHGQAAGYATRPKLIKYEKAIDVARSKLLSLGFTESPLAELTDIAINNLTPSTRALAARELALWHMRQKSDEDYRKALIWLSSARKDSPNIQGRANLSLIEMICHNYLNDKLSGIATYERAVLAGEINPELLLARTNFEVSADAKIDGINRALSSYGIEPVTLLPDEGQTTYDRLTCAIDIPRVTDGPKVTVLLAAYDAADMLPTALRSLQAQTWQNLEIIVLDDCSPSQDTVQVANAFAARDTRIQVIRMPENAGAYVARNHGLDIATGEFVTIHDADDWSHPRKIETQVRFMIEHPEVMGCTSEQSRCKSDLEMTRRASSRAGLILLNTSSFLWRRAPIVEKLGYWDTVRFGADSEFVRRVERIFGSESVVDMSTGPLSFQRDEASSITADDAKGFPGVSFGARRQYMETQTLHHKSGSSLKYSGNVKDRPFPAPNLMTMNNNQVKEIKFDVVIASDFRMIGGSTVSNSQEILCHKKFGFKTGVLPLFRYNSDDTRRPILPEIMSEIDGDLVNFATYGETITCDLLIIRYPSVVDNHLRYIPKINAKNIKVIVNQPPMSDYGPEGVVRYELKNCAENIHKYFGKSAQWHPIGPLVREAMHTHHADQLHYIDLSEDDWLNIIDINGWDRGPRKRGPKDKLRIGRHSRDHSHKWPDSPEDVLAVYPDREDVEVHVLGGGNTPAAIIGNIPQNWTVREFGSMHPRDFLKDIDVWVYFANPNWVESFGRTIIEAMATGVPVILPEIYRPLFKDSVLYATPQTALEMAQNLHADSAAYDRQVEKAKAYARDNFSFEMHVERLRKSGVNT